jgi:hypothetical protein
MAQRAPISATAAKAAAMLGLALWLACPAPAHAASFSLNGVTFSDRLGGFVLERVSGQGSMDDPFVIVERMTNTAGGILEFQVDPSYGNKINSQHSIGFALIKVIENGTGFTWNAFEIELQSKLGTPSDYADGLSFGQGSTAGRPFTAKGFSQVTVIDEPYDRVDFEEGKIRAGGEVTLRFVITESLPLTVAYLAQRPINPLAGIYLRSNGHSKNG